MSNKNRFKTLTAECPECESIVSFKAMPELGKMVECASCGTKLEVVYLSPIMLDWVDDDIPEEFDDDYDYDEFDSEFV